VVVAVVLVLQALLHLTQPLALVALEHLYFHLGVLQRLLDNCLVELIIMLVAVEVDLTLMLVHQAGLVAVALEQRLTLDLLQMELLILAAAAVGEQAVVTEMVAMVALVL
jgi:hypothetical protein